MVDVTGAFFSSGAALFVLLVSAALTVPVSLMLLWQYRRAVSAAMRAPAGPTTPAETLTIAGAPTDSAVVPQTPAPALVIEAVEHKRHRELPQEAGLVLRRALRGPWVAALVYGVAGLGHAVVTAVLWLLATDIAPSPGRILVLVLLYGWAIVLTTDLVTTSSRRMWSVALYFGGLAVMSFLLLENPVDLPILWVQLVGPPTLFLIAFLHRKLRAVGPLVFAFMIAAVGIVQLGGALLTKSGGVTAFTKVAVALGAGVEPLYWTITFLALGVLGWLGWLGLGWLGRRYTDKTISDQSLNIDSIWLIFTLIVPLDLAIEGSTWVVTVFGSFVVYKALVAAGFATVRRAAGVRKNYRLLVLRVFNSRGRSKRLMELVVSRWRYAGSIQLFAEVDQTTTNLEPYRFLDLVGGGSAGSYIKSVEGLEQRLAAMDLCPDSDGRFRVNEIPCLSDTWQMTLPHLLVTCDAVLMDLRGFSPKNRGCAYELRFLVNSVSLSRVVLIANGADEPFLRVVLDEAWARMQPTSPNYGHPARVRVCRLARANAKEIERLVAEIAVSAVCSVTATTSYHQRAPVFA